MANKRMFCKDIVGSDAFQDMPASSQLLYFHLGMEADDDGFIGNPKKIARGIGVAVDDMKILISKKFVIVFDSGVLVIKHHRINNNWDKYNCKRTSYLEEFEQLHIKENKAYTIDKTQGKPVQSENSLKTVFRIEENRIEENKEYSKSKDLPHTPLNELTYEPLKGNKTKGAFLDRSRAKKGKPPMLKKDPTTWNIINKYRIQYKYITGKDPYVGDPDYFHVLSITKKMSPEDMEAMITWYVKAENQKFKAHPSLKSIFTIENVNKFNLQK